jgi:hypothetical protein
MNYLDTLPDELITIIIHKIKYNSESFIKVSERHKILYSNFRSLINRGIFNPDTILNKDSDVISQCLYMKDIIFGFYIDSIHKLSINNEHMTIENKNNMVSYMHKNIDDILHIYAAIEYSSHETWYNNCKYKMLVAKTRNGNYIYFQKYIPEEYGTLTKFYVSNNWTYFWNKILDGLIKNYLLSDSKYIFDVPNNPYITKMMCYIFA